MKTDSAGQLEIAGSISGGVTTVYQGGDWTISSLSSSATIYAVVNTSAAGQASVVLDAGVSQIGSVTVSNFSSIGMATVSILNELSALATVNVSNTLTVDLGTNNDVVLNAGTNQIGSVTISNASSIGLATITVLNELSALATVNVSNVIGGVVTVAPRTDYVGLASISGNVVNLAGSAQIGSVTVSNELSALATVNVSNVVGGVVTVTPRTDYLGLVSVSGNVAISSVGAGTATIGIVRLTSGATITNAAGTAWIGLATVAVGNEIKSLSTVNVSNVLNSIVTVAPRADYIGLASVSGNVVNLAGTAHIGLVTVSNELSALATVNVSNTINALATVNVSNSLGLSVGGGKTLKHSTFALSATNLSGSTVFVSSADKKFYVTNLMLSTASVVGVAVMSGATYLNGNASVRMSFAAQSGLVENGGVDSPLYFGLANQQNFLLITSTAAPVSGRVTWFEE